MTSPPGGVDAHAHVLDVAAQSTVDGAAYEAFDAPAAAFLGHLDAVGAERGVVVNPSTYGTDHRVLLDALRAHPDRLPRAGQVRRRHAARGRPTLLERLAARSWHVQVWSDVGERLDVLLDLARAGAAPIVLDHLGFVPAPDDGHEDAGIPPLLELLATGTCWVKLSRAYRLAPGPREADAARRLTARVDAVLRAAPDRVVWGSDWPYVACPGPRPTDADHVAVLDLWLTDPDLRRRVLVTNPARLYDW